ncbi:MAG: cupin domain-containing protein [bacterium]|nr:cupin domain-containing protein [bacterium]
MAEVIVVHPDDDVTTVHGAGDAYRFLITGPQSNGKYFAMDARVPPGAGPPPHIQTREEEAFYVLDGELVFRADGQRIVGRQGTFVHVPRGVAHHFKNESDKDARVLIWFGPAGIETMMERMAASPDDYEAIGKEYGVTFVDKA